ncbi:LysR family transcriptional regulator [Bordetella sp. 15P40C-2]|uniref:LysR family transcriptional regulator n=1 Tax=Bordetella sp. 15P40C-2 TaxID=2572246 RepID=UPI0013295E00|nr:LysR family transcriptional regulator [Bordetella sp. 15P40C-2]MVW69983.1 LysR family transcriptional regulator [Bordetella sp. 15P40C-2]
MNLNLLKVFDAVMQERNVTRAAERLCISQSAVSNALAKLRTEFKDELFVRHLGGVAPTARAELIWPNLRAAIREVNRIRLHNDFDPRLSSATFRIAASDYAHHFLLAPFIKYLLREAPHVSLSLCPYAMDRLEEMLREGEIDVAAGILPNIPEEFPNMVIEVIPYVCVMRKDHPLAQKPMTVEAFSTAKHLRISVSASGTSAIEGHLEGYGIRRQIALTLNQISIAPRIVSETDLLALLPRKLVENSRYSGRLHVTETPVPIPGNQVKLVWHRRNDDVPPHRWLRHSLVRCVKNGTTHEKTEPTRLT